MMSSKTHKSHLSKLSLCLFILAVIASACVANKHGECPEKPCLTSINIVDRNGLTETINNPERIEQFTHVNFLTPQPYQKVLRIYTRDCQGNIPAIITSYHPNGYPSKYLEVVNSRACGVYKEWFPNGTQKVCAYVMEGTADIVNGSEKTWIFDGCCQAWNENGELEASIPYVKGTLEGVSTYYHSNGNVWKLIPYCQNLVNGTAEIFCCDGTILQSSTYCNGVKEGPSLRYWDPERIAAEETYCEGLLASGRYYDCQGVCIAKIDNGSGMRAIFGKDCVLEMQEYRGGLLEGEVRVLDRNGRVINIYHAKNGNKHGEEIIYYEMGRFQENQVPKLSLNWFEGKIQGVAKTWYSNGVQESQKEMTNNKKNGHSTAWYHDGSLMMIEEYEQDKLMKGEYFNRGEKYPISIIDDGKGIASLFDTEGNFVRKIEYRNGKPVLEE